ncbi:MAG: aminomethyl-transferring glycine dehydrogenase subunit GcvPA [Phycisphaerales bacterium]|nr:MAG: aminomethyl-transferring glycine dehydrogenase subunit GcvPA [Phycisphaerales bacterium]
MRYTQFTDDQVSQMLSTIGVDSIDALLSTIPEQLRFKERLDIPAGLSELELLRDVGTLAARNRNCNDLVCFLGCGAYDHFIPAVVDEMAGQSEFLTAYTPYQAEASQGVLQLFYEFQTMICMLTGMEVANASLYEAASAAAEAVIMAAAATRRTQAIVAQSAHPDTRRVLETYCRAREIEIVPVAAPNGVVDQQALREALSDKAAAVVVQSPNFFGCVERLDEIVPAIHQHGALAIVATDPIAGGLLKTPGEFDVDIVVGEGQALGVPLQYGGPYLGLMAGREKFLRKMPGRVVGATTDADGRRAFCLALQTREQHIKRERATSNICTNQGLLAARAAVYMAAMGRSGIGQVASRCFDKAHYAAAEIAKLDGYELRFDAPFFKEFVIRTTRGVRAALGSCRERGILGGVSLVRFDDQLGDCFSVAVTEKRTKAEIDNLIVALDAA